jgi:hypothetical protein
MENLQLMRPSQSKHTMLTPQWNVQIPLYNPSVQLEFAYSRVVAVVICDICGSFQSKDMHFLAEVTQMQPCIAVSFLHHTVGSTLHVSLVPQRIWSFLCALQCRMFAKLSGQIYSNSIPSPHFGQKH